MWPVDLFKIGSVKTTYPVPVLDSLYPGASAQFLDLPSCGSGNPPSGPQVQTLVFYWLTYNILKQCTTYCIGRKRSGGVFKYLKGV